MTTFAEKREHTNFLVVNTIPPDDGQDISPTEFVTRLYFQKRMDKVARSHDNIEHVQVHQYPEQWDRGHPTVECTKKLLKVISSFQKDLILNEKFSTTGSIYRGVTGVYLSGCTGCPSRGRFASGGFCSACLRKIDVDDIEDKDILNECQKMCFEDYPQGQKRSRDVLTSSDDGSYEGKLPKL